MLLPEPAETFPPSPVPADENLWPGEKPFTCFGQFGHGALDKRVFEQDTYWVDITGTPHLLTDMSPDYRTNVIAFLIAGAPGFWLGAVERLVVTLTGDLALGRVSGDLLAASLGDTPLHEMTPQEWLDSTPLMRRLRALQP